MSEWHAKRTTKRVPTGPRKSIIVFYVLVMTLSHRLPHDQKTAAVASMTLILTAFTVVSGLNQSVYICGLLLTGVVRSVRMEKKMFVSCVKAQLSFFV